MSEDAPKPGRIWHQVRFIGFLALSVGTIVIVVSNIALELARNTRRDPRE